eukprot:14162530-Ditylum_brightwellii.AAC.1
MKKQRRRATVSGALGRSVVKGVVHGPVGAFVGGVGGAAAAKKILRKNETNGICADVLNGRKEQSGGLVRNHPFGASYALISSSEPIGNI